MRGVHLSTKQRFTGRSSGRGTTFDATAATFQLWQGVVSRSIPVSVTPNEHQKPSGNPTRRQEHSHRLPCAPRHVLNTEPRTIPESGVAQSLENSFGVASATGRKTRSLDHNYFWVGIKHQACEHADRILIFSMYWMSHVSQIFFQWFVVHVLPYVTRSYTQSYVRRGRFCCQCLLCKQDVFSCIVHTNTEPSQTKFCMSI